MMLGRFCSPASPPRRPQQNRARFLGWVALVVALATFGVAQADRAPPLTLGELLAMIDPADDPGVTHFEREALRSPPAWPDIVRWSAQATAEIDVSGVPSGSISGRIALPLEPDDVLAVRSERHRVSTRLAELQRDELARGYVYAVLELACRWGYLASAEPLLFALAELDQAAAPRWRAKAHATQWEREALSTQLAVYAPAVAGHVSNAPRGFMCRFSPVHTWPDVDELDQHPNMERVALERRNDELQEDFMLDIGVPELTLDGSLRYGGGNAAWNADVRVSVHVPIRMPGATASVDVAADAVGAGLTVRVDGTSVPVRGQNSEPIAATLSREYASIELRLAGLRANQAMLRAESAAFGEVGDADQADAASCRGLCPVPDGPSTVPPELIARLDALALAWELARLEIEARTLLALPPTDLLARPGGE